MSEVISIEQSRRRGLPWPGGGRYKGPAEFFDRRELNEILQLYSRKVMTGEWLDYALGQDERGAVFAIYGRLATVPLFRILKRRGRRGRYQVSARGQVLGESDRLDGALQLLERRAVKLVRD